jgi:hypothetical protein
VARVSSFRSTSLKQGKRQKPCAVAFNKAYKFHAKFSVEACGDCGLQGLRLICEFCNLDFAI